jgi:8-oxo-dGTP pyrophosphatase MutT (NUDIX family)
MNDKFKDLLLEDYRHVRDSFWKYEQGGETRVNLFIGLVTFGLGGLAALFTKKPPVDTYQLQLIALAGLAALLLVGAITFLRIVSRNVNSDRAKYQMDMIRRTFADHYDQDSEFFDYELFPNLPRSQRRFGGLAHTVAAINGLLCGAILAIILNLFPLNYSVFSANRTLVVFAEAVLCLAAFFVIFRRQVSYAHNDESKAKKNFPILFNQPTHAGGVVYEVRNKKPHYLLVTAENDKRIWVLPKGHIDEGEQPSETAIREVKEEAAVIGKIVGVLGATEYDLKNPLKTIKIRFYLMKKIAETKSPPETDEHRGALWLVRDEAIQKLNYPESKTLIRRADEMISKRKLAE